MQYAPEKVQKILVGNKSDDVDKRQVATEQGAKVCQPQGLVRTKHILYFQF